MERMPWHRVSDPEQGEVGVCKQEVTIAPDTWTHVKRWIKYMNLSRIKEPGFSVLGKGIANIERGNARTLERTLAYWNWN